MYSVRVYFIHPRKGLIVRYLTFDTYTMAMDCYYTLTGERENKTYPKDLYFNLATITHTAIGELFNENSIECELLSEYLGKTI
ncbi:hypothetical protein Bcp1_020 [Bacillus phage Bcp1]|uniref:Uncharacterized protein n=1 Tax=Bacillus phage Bcp1 TaxID=584892 RepID=X2JMM9_9CAUD|nr:hypothetical protein Bcp1_020 [Bacillus phage Bcp1]AHN66497.1 hypothetical protein Bcp1_020 [Bacillus phage Bcp1]